MYFAEVTKVRTLQAEIAAEIERIRDEAEYIGLRVDDEVVLAVGDRAPNSRIWDDGEPTEECVNGTCAVDATDLDLAIKIAFILFRRSRLCRRRAVCNLRHGSRRAGHPGCYGHCNVGAAAMTPADLEAIRSRLGISSWDALAEALGVSVRRVYRWLADGVPEHDQKLVELAVAELTRRLTKEDKMQTRYSVVAHYRHGSVPQERPADEIDVSVDSEAVTYRLRPWNSAAEAAADFLAAHKAESRADHEWEIVDCGGGLFDLRAA